MNEDKLKIIIEQAFPDQGPEAPASDMWRNIRDRLPEKQPESKRRINPRLWILVGALGGATLLLVLLLQRPDSPNREPTLSPEIVSIPGIEQLRTRAPDIYAQNKPAIDALDLAIGEILVELERKPDDSLLRRRLDYYTSWQTEMVSELLQWKQRKTDATG